MSYRLRENFYAREVDDETVFFDLSGDRYYLAPSRLHQAFSSMTASRGQVVDEIALWPLIAQGFLVGGHWKAPPVVVDDRMQRRTAAAQSVPPHLIVEAIGWQARAGISLRLGSLHQVVDDLRRRKAVIGEGAPNLPDVAIRSAAFRASAKYFPTDQKCLRRSVALADHVLRRGHGVAIYFGVAVKPFAAHCWVQSGDVVLNDDADNVGRYAPILII